MNNLKLLLPLLFTATFCKAQILNIDKLYTLPYSNKAKFEGNISAGLEIDKQNSTLYDASNFLDATLQKNKLLHIFSASNRFTYNGPQDFLNTGYIHYRLRNHYKAPLHPESFIQYQWDAKIGIRGRFVVGENLRYNLWHHKSWEMTFGLGVMYENEVWDYGGVDTAKHIKPGPDVKTSVIKSNNYVKWEGNISPTATIKLAVFYQAAYTSFFKPRLFSVFSFNIDATKHFGISLNYSGTYDSNPLVPIAPFYYSLSNNLVYKF